MHLRIICKTSSYGSEGLGFESLWAWCFCCLLGVDSIQCQRTALALLKHLIHGMPPLNSRVLMQYQLMQPFCVLLRARPNFPFASPLSYFDSRASAIPIPPPTQRLPKPVLISPLFIRWARCAVMRAPLVPIGCPSAMAPP